MTHRAGAATRQRCRPASLSLFLTFSHLHPSLPLPSPPACFLPYYLSRVPHPSQPSSSPSFPHTHTHARICTHTQIVHKIICLICQAQPTAPDSSSHMVRLFLRHSVQEVPDRSCSQPSPPTDLAAAVLMASVPDTHFLTWLQRPASAAGSHHQSDPPTAMEHLLPARL